MYITNLLFSDLPKTTRYLVAGFFFLTNQILTYFQALFNSDSDKKINYPRSCSRFRKPALSALDRKRCLVVRGHSLCEL